MVSYLHRIAGYAILAGWALGLLSVATAAIPADESGTPVGAEAAIAQAANGEDCHCEHYRFRGWLREKIVCDRDLERYGLKLDDDWQMQPRDKPVVLLIHGFNSCPQRNAAILAPIREAQFPCGNFAYPNDHTIETSAQLLSCELRRFAAQYPDRRVVLVCHSMGGMVARACIEDPVYDPGNVMQLIMIAPPSHGTLIAHFAVGTDLWEHWLSRRDGGTWTRMRDSIVDGLGEAADDLCPGSEFLHDLNARQRNPHVRYSILLGTGALMSETQVEWIRQSVCAELAKVPGGARSAKQLDAILNDIDELVDGRGDGVVAVKRGRLEGVSDIVLMPFGHLAVTGDGSDAVLQSVHQAVLNRLQ